MDNDRKRISVIEPIGPAIERVKLMLFRPFDIGKWFAVGFCAWLAQLVEGVGCFRFRVPFGNCNSCINQFGQVWNALQGNVVFFLLVGAGVVIFAVVIWLVLLWLSSRGRFMFLNCVARNTGMIKLPWYEFAGACGNLFLFRLLASIIMFLFALPFAAGTVWCGWLLSRGGVYVNAFLITAMVFMVVLLIAGSVMFFVVMKFTRDFVVPLMYIHGVSCIDAWGRLLGLISGNKGRFLLYLLFQILIAAVIGTIIGIAVLATCCCAACFFMIPYIGTVALLPVLIFERAYSVYYLRQYGGEFDVFAQAE